MRRPVKLYERLFLPTPDTKSAEPEGDLAFHQLVRRHEESKPMEPGEGALDKGFVVGEAHQKRPHTQQRDKLDLTKSYRSLLLTVLLESRFIENLIMLITRLIENIIFKT